MSFLQDLFKDATAPTGSLTQELFGQVVTTLVPGWGGLIAAAALGIPKAIDMIRRAVSGTPVTAEELVAAWPAIQSEAIRVGAAWDASERKKPDSTV